MGAHMLGLADELLDYNPELYDARLRFLLMASVTLGWIWGNVDDLSRTAYALIFAFIAGSVVASGTQSALPRISSATALPAFITGAFLYSIMLLMIEHFAD
jgi:amino acid permease